MPEFFSSDGPYFLQFLVIFLVILVLLMGAALLFRRLAGRGLSLSARSGHRGRQPRLGIVDIYELDRQRQLILLRRDNVEHLLLVGGPNDVVVERNVVRGAGTRMPAESVMRSEGTPNVPASELAAPGSTHEALPEPDPGPRFEMPVVVPPPLSGVHTDPAARTPPLDPGLFAPDSELAAAPEPAEPVRSRIGISQVGRILRRTPPPLVGPRPETTGKAEAAEPAPTPEPPGDAAKAAPGAPIFESEEPRPADPAVLSDMARQLETALRRPASAAAPPPAKPAAKPAGAPAQSPAAKPAPAEPRPGQAAGPASAKPVATEPDPIAAGMAAARAPSPSPPTFLPEPASPEPTQEAAPKPAPAPEAEAKPEAAPTTGPDRKPAPEPKGVADPKPAPGPKPVAAAPSASPPKPTAAPEPDPKPEPAATIKPVPRPAAIPDPAPVAPAKPEPKPAPEPEPATALPGDKAAKPGANDKPSAPQPFTLEEIEAEFARLLGRQVDPKN